VIDDALGGELKAAMDEFAQFYK
jgi:hypothetical protein